MHKDEKTTDHGRTRQKFRCPFRQSKTGVCSCNHKNWKNGKKNRGCTKYQTLPTDYRLSIDGECFRFKRIYACALSANATIPASRPLGRNVSGSAAAAALLISTPWHISLLWLLLWPPFFPALTPTAHPNSSGAPPDPPHPYPISGAVHSRAWISAPFGRSKALPVPSSYSNGIFIRLFCSSLNNDKAISAYFLRCITPGLSGYHTKLPMKSP